MKIKINKPLQEHKAGSIIDIKDNNGIPLERYWRNRLYDSRMDNCIEIIKKEIKKTKNKMENKK